MATESAAGRPRDTALDGAIVDATLELLGDVGYGALTISAVADRAGTTRPAVYRRYRTKAELAVAALASLSSSTVPQPTGDHLADLVAELTTFRDGIRSANGVALAAAVLQDGADRAMVTAYRRLVVEPRRSRIRRILDTAADAGAIDASDDDRAVAVTMCTGSWYAFALAGRRPPADWPERTARLVWRAVGGGGRQRRTG